NPAKGFAKGDLKFALLGEKLQGEWVLVRMKNDRMGGNRTNWLLIKHRDQYAKEGDDEGVLANSRSVASGRSLDEIAAGKRKAPPPFMMTRQTANAEAVWHANKGLAAEERAKGAARIASPRARIKAGTTPSAASTVRTKASSAARAVKVDAMPDFVAPQLC